MAQKDWKFINKYENEGEEYYFYSNQKNGDNLNIGKSNVEQGKWFVSVNYGNKLEKRFNSKVSAILFAKKYMRLN